MARACFEGRTAQPQTLSFTCSWDDTTIFEQEAKAGLCDGVSGGNGSGGAGGASGACPLGEIEVPACATGQVPTTSCGTKCVDFEHYLDAVDNCPPPEAVVLDCYNAGTSNEYCSLECR